MGWDADKAAEIEEQIERLFVPVNHFVCESNDVREDLEEFAKAARTLGLLPFADELEGLAKKLAMAERRADLWVQKRTGEKLVELGWYEASGIKPFPKKPITCKGCGAEQFTGVWNCDQCVPF